MNCHNHPVHLLSSRMFRSGDVQLLLVLPRSTISLEPATNFAKFEQQVYICGCLLLMLVIHCFLFIGSCQALGHIKFVLFMMLLHTLHINPSLWTKKLDSLAEARQSTTLAL